MSKTESRVPTKREERPLVPRPFLLYNMNCIVIKLNLGSSWIWTVEPEGWSSGWPFLFARADQRPATPVHFKDNLFKERHSVIWTNQQIPSVFGSMITLNGAWWHLKRSHLGRYPHLVFWVSLVLKSHHIICKDKLVRRKQAPLLWKSFTWCNSSASYYFEVLAVTGLLTPSDRCFSTSQLLPSVLVNSLRWDI